MQQNIEEIPKDDLEQGLLDFEEFDYNKKIQRRHNEKIPRLSKKEKDYISKIAAISGYSFSTVKEVFLSTAVCATMNLYSNDNELNIPYLFNTTIEITDGKVNFKTKSNYSLKTILKKLIDGETTWVEEYVIYQIQYQLKKKTESA